MTKKTRSIGIPIINNAIVDCGGRPMHARAQ
jgi:hypothetical protein